jgi:hypothetical protein
MSLRLHLELLAAQEDIITPPEITLPPVRVAPS